MQLYIDLSEILDMKEILFNDDCFNVPLSVFSSSSYFGDNDVLLQKISYRQTTAVCMTKCQILSVKTRTLESCLAKSPQVHSMMVQIAEEKNNYQGILKDEIKFKYKTHRA